MASACSRDIAQRGDQVGTAAHHQHVALGGEGRSTNTAALSASMGTRDIISTPPATITCSWPAVIFRPLG